MAAVANITINMDRRLIAWCALRAARDERTIQRFIIDGYNGLLVRRGLWADIEIDPRYTGPPDDTIYEYLDQPSTPPWGDEKPWQE